MPYFANFTGLKMSFSGKKFVNFSYVFAQNIDSGYSSRKRLHITVNHSFFNTCWVREDSLLIEKTKYVLYSKNNRG